MIVRINQLDPTQFERESGWLSGGAMGPLGGDVALPGDMRAFELVILGQDEQRRPVTEAFRQTQLRHLIPEAAAALREPGEEVAIRLDGPIADGELASAFRRLTDPSGQGRFAFSAAQKLQHAPSPVVGSVRLLPTYTALCGLCSDTTLGLERSVRLRAIAAPEALAAMVLELAAPDDPRWAQVLAAAGFLIAPTRGLRSLQILTRRFDASVVKTRIMHRLLSAATAPAGGGVVAGAETL